MQVCLNSLSMDNAYPEMRNVDYIIHNPNAFFFVWSVTVISIGHNSTLLLRRPFIVEEEDG